ncbi:hypothetical protein Bpfe_008914, partial [Biomphalaria pfeifferi]
MVTPFSTDLSSQVLNCVNNINCGGLICDDWRALCSPCFKDSVQALNFSASWTGVYLKKRRVISDTPYNQISTMTKVSYPVPSGLIPGDV